MRNPCLPSTPRQNELQRREKQPLLYDPEKEISNTIRFARVGIHIIFKTQFLDKFAGSLMSEQRCTSLSLSLSQIHTSGQGIKKKEYGFWEKQKGICFTVKAGQ
nr:hypothetical protein CFP56_18368 [Quercus suber]